MHGRSGLPVLSGDREHLRGWITRRDVLTALAHSIEAAGRRIEAGAVAADFGAETPERAAHAPSAPLDGYQIVDLSITPARPRPAAASAMSPGRRAPSWLRSPMRGEAIPALPQTVIGAGERVVLLAPAQSNGSPITPAGSPPPAAA